MASLVELVEMHLSHQDILVPVKMLLLTLFILLLHRFSARKLWVGASVLVLKSLVRKCYLSFLQAKANSLATSLDLLLD